MGSKIIIIAGCFAAIAVILGAMGAHSLKGVLSPELLQSFETGVQYQFYHSFALLIIAALKKNYTSKFFTFSTWFFIAGIILFSFSIYLLSIRELINMPGLKVLGTITPFGGISFILGWMFLIIAGFESKKESH